jgi:hypothetical protein
MTYRKIDVNGTTYEYTVGRTHIKVRGLGALPKHGNVTMIPLHCECCYEPLATLYPNRPINETHAPSVQPHNVRELILSHVKEKK